MAKTDNKQLLNSDRIDFTNGIAMEQAMECGKLILLDMFEEFFWTIYRKDDDLEMLKLKCIDSGQLSESHLDIVIPSIQMFVDEFSALKDTTKEQDNIFIREKMNLLVEKVSQTFQEIIPNFFEIQ